MKKIIDTRDLQERLSELQNLSETLDDAHKELRSIEDDPDCSPEDIEKAQEIVDLAEIDFGTDEVKELEEIQGLAYEIPEWKYGNTLIHEAEWVDYVQELCEDIGDIPKNIPHYIEIDWGKTADNIKQDYGEVQFQGETYYYRNC